MDGVQARSGQSNRAQGDLAYRVVAQRGEQLKLFVDAPGGVAVEEVGGAHSEKLGERLQMTLGRVVPDALAQLPDVRVGDRHSAVADRGGDLLVAELAA